MKELKLASLRLQDRELTKSEHEFFGGERQTAKGLPQTNYEENIYKLAEALTSAFKESSTPHPHIYPQSKKEGKFSILQPLCLYFP